MKQVLPTLFKIIRPDKAKILPPKKICPIVKITFVSRYINVFNHFSVKICEKSTFLVALEGKSKGNKTVSKFGPFSAPFLEIPPEFGRRFVRPLTFYCIRLLNYAAERLVSWQHCKTQFLRNAQQVCQIYRCRFTTVLRKLWSVMMCWIHLQLPLKTI